MRDYPDSVPFVKSMLRHLDLRKKNEEAQRWRDIVHYPLVAPQQSGAIRGWFYTNRDCAIETLQFTFDSDANVIDVWKCGARTAEGNPMGVRLYNTPEDYIDRPYLGVLTLGAVRQTYVGYERDRRRITAYHLIAPGKV